VGAKADKGSSTDNTRTLKLSTRGDREIVLTRVFDASRRDIFDAYTKPELVRQWLLGPQGWSMPVCEVDLKAGGAYRYVWRHTSGREMGMGGIYREIVPQQRTVCTELYDDAWYPGEAVTTTTLVERRGATTLTTAILYVSKEARDKVLTSAMERGVAASYDRLEEILALSQAARMKKRPRRS
jgi:uncharacterized protein YndB with AHSA1/START domain